MNQDLTKVFVPGTTLGLNSVQWTIHQTTHVNTERAIVELQAVVPIKTEGAVTTEPFDANDRAYLTSLLNKEIYMYEHQQRFRIVTCELLDKDTVKLELESFPINPLMNAEDNTQKVYCISCQYFHERHEHCMHIAAIKHIDTWKEQAVKHVKTPQDINNNNDCQHYEPKSTKNLIFCSRCKYGAHIDDECDHPDNLTIEHDWCSEYKDRKQDCSVKNWNNSCLDFEKK